MLSIKSSFHLLLKASKQHQQRCLIHHTVGSRFQLQNQPQNKQQTEQPKKIFSTNDNEIITGSSSSPKLDFETPMLPVAQTLPVFVSPTRFMRLKEFMGYQGGLSYPQPVLSVAALNLYLCIQYQIDFDKFFKKLNYPDVFYSYCLINFLHVWLLSVPLIHYGRSGIHVRKLLHQNMWKDIEARAKKLNSAMSRENKLKAYNHLNDIFKAFLFGFDEGILSDDTVLAGAVWRHLLQQKEIEDYSVLVEMCDYIRKNVSHLDTITEVDLLKNGVVSFVDFEQKNLDHSKVRVKLIEKLTHKLKRKDD